tara:strand:- start:113 stop:706 length:594 start_codon:yes stop_codon:yes gene_type:complete
MSKTTYDLMREGELIAMRMADLFQQEADEGLSEEVGRLAQAVRDALDQHEGDLSEKYLRIDFAKKRAEQDIEALKAQVATFQKAIKASQKTIGRCKDLGIAIFHSRQATIGDEEGKSMKLPDGSKAWLVQKETYPKPVWSKRNEHLLPADVKVEEVIARVDKDKLLAWTETATALLDERGEPVVTIEWVDGTHTRRK